MSQTTDLCINCKNIVRPRQHGVQCDVYLRWQHRLCKTAAWLAVRQVFPTVTIKGCVFHLTTAIFKYAARLGLKPLYMERGSLQNYIRSLLALPFLPAQHIEPAFVELASRANSPATKELCSYINGQWINHPVFDISSWSVFGLTVRTNNDVEGWHNRLNNACAGHTLSFYRLVPALRSEAGCVGYEVAHGRQGVSTRRIRPVSKTIENKNSKCMGGVFSQKH